MKIEQISKNSYRVRKQYKGTKYTLFFDHKPSDKEVTLKLSELYSQDTFSVAKSGTLGHYMNEYISVKSNVLSPSTIRGYDQMISMYPKWILNKNIYDLTQVDIQKCINEYSENHSAKSVKNYNGFIVSVLKMFRPQFRCATTLPQKTPTDFNLPTQEEVMQIIADLDGTEYHIPIQLACLGLRKSEILALDVSDLDGNILSINKGLVIDKDNNIVVKDMPKTFASVRQIYIPDGLAAEIRERGYIFKSYPSSLSRALHRSQDKLGIPRFRLHDLRHFYVSYAHSMGMSDADIMAAGGWTTDEVMKRVYRHSMDREKEEQQRIANQLFN